MGTIEDHVITTDGSQLDLPSALGFISKVNRLTQQDWEHHYHEREKHADSHVYAYWAHRLTMCTVMHGHAAFAKAASRCARVKDGAYEKP